MATEAAPEQPASAETPVEESKPLAVLRQLAADIESLCGSLSESAASSSAAGSLRESHELLTQMQQWAGKMPESRIRESLLSMVQQLDPLIESLQSDDAESNPVADAVRSLGVDVDISADSMSAFLILPKTTAKYWIPEALAEAVEAEGVKHGINEKIFKAMIVKKAFDKRVRVARGKQPEPGADARIEDPLNLLARAHLVGLETGTRIDYKEQTVFSAVKEGDVILNKVAAEPGVPGMNVLGEELPPTPGADVAFPPNTNCRASDDGLTLYAATDGCIYFKSGALNLVPALNIEGNVDYNSGNVKSPVAVQIKGDVLSDFRVESEEEIAVGGVIEGAVMRAGKSILCSGGVEGKEKASLHAGEDFQSKYIKNAMVKAERSVTTQGEIIQSEIRARRVKCEGDDGCIIGGRVYAWEDVCAKEIGSEMGVKTEIILGGELPELEDKINRLQTLFLEKKEQFAAMAEAQSKSMSVGQGSAEMTDVDSELNEEAEKLKNEIDAVEMKLKQARSDFDSSQSMMRTVRASETLHPGAVIRILGKGMEIKKPTGPTMITIVDGKLTPMPYQELELDEDAEEVA